MGSLTEQKCCEDIDQQNLGAYYYVEYSNEISFQKGWLGGYVKI